MEKPKVSILIPVCNGEKYIGAAIESVLSQSYRDFELIIVDDNSNDNSFELITIYKDQRIKNYRNDRNLGMAGNWNRCIELATGKYITMLHQDDIMLPNNVDCKLNILQKNNYKWVASDCIQIGEMGETIHEHWFRHSIAMKVKNKSKKKQFNEMFFNSNFLCFPTIFWARELFNEAGMFEEKGGYCLDVYLWLKFLYKERIYYIPEQLIKYRWAINASKLYDDDDWFYDNFLARREIVNDLRLGGIYKLYLKRKGIVFLLKYLASFRGRDKKKALKMLNGFKMAFKATLA